MSPITLVVIVLLVLLLAGGGWGYSTRWAGWYPGYGIGFGGLGAILVLLLILALLGYL